MKIPASAVIITIGDELLIGQTIDTNSAWMAQQLTELGVSILRRYAIADIETEIVLALDQAMKDADLVLMTGGLGPTRDDITKETLCKYFNTKLRINENVLAHVTDIFSKYNRPLLEVNRQQAAVPEVCTVLYNPTGTAPGMWFERNNAILVAMPGVPFEMKNIMNEEVLPRLRKRERHQFIYHANIITAGVGESYLAEQLSDIEDAMPAHIGLAYLPSMGSVKMRLSAQGPDEAILKKEVAVVANKIKEKVKKYIAAETDIPMAEIVIKLLQERKLSVATAESCTGGYIASLLTDVAGASSVYFGSTVAYHYDVKENLLGVNHETLVAHGAVSEEVVLQMATECRKIMQTDLAVSISGILGPGGATPDKSVGTVWMAVADSHGAEAKVFHFRHDRIRNKESAALAALNFLRLRILGEEIKN